MLSGTKMTIRRPSCPVFRNMGGGSHRSQCGFFLVVVACLALVAGACAPRVSRHGNPLDDDRVAMIKPGVHSARDVQQILGSPSSRSLFDGEAWYYVGDRTEVVAFFQPVVTERRGLVVRFDSSGIVTSVQPFGLDQSRPVKIVGRETPTTGNEMTVWEQFVGNIGRFEGDKKKQRP